MSTEDCQQDFDEKARALAKQLCDSLKDDLELQLETEEELYNHLMEAYDSALERGNNEEEAEESAFSHFGDTSELSQMLLEGNLKRMKLRARVRFFLSYCFPPLVIVMALVIGLYSWNIFSLINRGEVKKDLIREFESLISDRSPNAKKGELFSEIERTYEDNAFVDLLWLSWQLNEHYDSEEKILKGVSTEEVKERVRLFNERSDYDDLRKEFLQRKENLVSSNDTFIDNIRIIGIRASTVLTELTTIRDVGAILLSEEISSEKKWENVVLLDRFYQRVMEESSRLLINDLVLMSAYGQIYESLKDHSNLPSHIAEIRDRSLKIQGISEEQKKLRRQKNDEVSSKAGIMVAMVLPGLGYMPEVDELSPSRRFEMTSFTRMWNQVISVFFILLLAMVLFVVSSLKLLKVRKLRINLLLEFKQIRKLVFYFIILPFLVFEVYKILPFSSHSWSIGESLVYFIVEQIVLFLVLPMTFLFVMSSLFKKKMITLGMSFKSNFDKLIYFSWGIMAVILIFLYSNKVFFSDNDGLIHYVIGQGNYDSFTRGPALAGMTFGAVAYYLITVIILMRSSGRVYRLVQLKGVAISVAIYVLFLSLYSNVYLYQQERYFCSKDKLLIPSSDGVGMTQLEMDVSTRLRQKMLETWEGKWER